MLQFSARNAQELEEELAIRSNEIAVETIRGIVLALENDVDAVLLGFIPSVHMDVTVKRSGFLSALEINVNRCAEAEEFELCKEATKWIKILKESETK
jgi:hypothetical protein